MLTLLFTRNEQQFTRVSQKRKYDNSATIWLERLGKWHAIYAAEAIVGSAREVSTIEVVDSEEAEMRLHVVADQKAAIVCQACAGTVHCWCHDRDCDGHHSGCGRRSLEVGQCSWAVWGVVSSCMGKLRFASARSANVLLLIYTLLMSESFCLLCSFRLLLMEVHLLRQDSSCMVLQRRLRVNMHYKYKSWLAP